jgi:predicted Zn-dependent peptidase
MPEADRTAIVVDWESEWAQGAEHPSAAHIGAMLMTSGGAGGDLEALIRESSELGAHAELNATADGARGLLVAREGRLAEAAALAREALTGSRLDAGSFESLRAGLAEGVRSAEAPAEALVSDAARRLLLGEAPLREFLALPVDDIEGVTLAEVRAWRDAVFGQANATVAAAGVAPPEAVAAAVDTLLESLPERPVGAAADAPQPEFRGRTVLVVAPEAEVAAIGVFGPLPPTGELGGVLDVLTLEALDRRLKRGLRRELGDGLDISARPANYARDVRLLAIGGEVAPGEAGEVLAATRAIYERFRERGPTRREAARSARHAARMFAGAEAVPEAVAQIVAELVLDQGPTAIAEDLPGRLRSVERRALRAHVTEALPPWEEMLRIVVTPDPGTVEADCVVETLSALDSCR